MNNAYNLRDVYFKYSDKWILEDISFDIKNGEILGIIGPNGSGKTTLLKLLSRILTPGRGDITVKGIDIAKYNHMDFARSVAVVPQESSFLFPFTVAEAVLMGRSPYLKGRLFENYHDAEVSAEAMKWMDIYDLKDRPVTDISGGERQRTIIARALAQEPDILILDEPTTSLDIGHQTGIYNLLTRLNSERGLTIVLSSHDLNLAAQYCNKLILMNKGKIYDAGTPFEVITEGNIRDVYGCEVIVDENPVTKTPRVTLIPGETPMNLCFTKEYQDTYTTKAHI